MTRDEAASPRCARTVLAAALRKSVVNLLNGTPGQIAKGRACRFDPVGSDGLLQAGLALRSSADVPEAGPPAAVRLPAGFFESDVMRLEEPHGELAVRVTVRATP
jgi:hypothetical protein